MALTLEQEQALLALLHEKRTTLPELSAATSVNDNDLFLINQMLADKSVTAEVLKQFIAPDATLSRKGVVQLSNRIDSDSETEAATSKAVKAACDLASSKLSEAPVLSVNGKMGDVNITVNDIGALTPDEADKHYLRLENAPVFMFLYPGGSETSPALLALNTRIEINNPYPNHIIETAIEVYYNGIWGRPGHVLGSSTYGYGSTATPVYESNIIVVQTGRGSVIPPSYGTGNPFNTDNKSVGSVPYRVLVRKIS